MVPVRVVQMKVCMVLVCIDNINVKYNLKKENGKWLWLVKFFKLYLQ